MQHSCEALKKLKTPLWSGFGSCGPGQGTMDLLRSALPVCAAQQTEGCSTTPKRRSIYPRTTDFEKARMLKVAKRSDAQET